MVDISILTLAEYIFTAFIIIGLAAGVFAAFKMLLRIVDYYLNAGYRDGPEP